MDLSPYSPYPYSYSPIRMYADYGPVPLFPLPLFVFPYSYLCPLLMDLSPYSPYIPL